MVFEIASIAQLFILILKSVVDHSNETELITFSQAYKFDLCMLPTRAKKKVINKFIV